MREKKKSKYPSFVSAQRVSRHVGRDVILKFLEERESWSLAQSSSDARVGEGNFRFVSCPSALAFATTCLLGHAVYRVVDNVLIHDLATRPRQPLRLGLLYTDLTTVLLGTSSFSSTSYVHLFSIVYRPQLHRKPIHILASRLRSDTSSGYEHNRLDNIDRRCEYKTVEDGHKRGVITGPTPGRPSLLAIGNPKPGTKLKPALGRMAERNRDWI
ncbi:hypothetical protein P154DRAFT_572013 [Amniculicola lignicola CBS 123094]|uniref:Uncharacterized protein n=1 Tax=Amniculicola lignicola CBS 123094 TaxID=1392246 RepID=A0A6A5X1R5_9PLEO|nr:hypothetical protein P154DRAFT_572013 [Amniculicola lignicola CBS 123094]